jgi:hypothetical protein
MFAHLKNLILFVPRKIYKINKLVNGIRDLPEKVSDTSKIATKVFGVTLGSATAAKGTVDLLEALSCGDVVCATVSSIGLSADILQCVASFVPGPNVAVVVTLPVSVFC